MKRQGVVLAGGKGERLHRLTENQPKCMVEIAGRPQVLYMLDQMVAGGVNHVAIVCPATHLDTVAETVIASHKSLAFTFIPEMEPRGEVEALLLAWEFLARDGDTIVCYSDNIVDGRIVEALINTRKNEGTDYPVFATAPWQSPYSIVNDKASIRYKPMLPVLIGWMSFYAPPEYLKSSPVIHQERDWRKYRIAHTMFTWFDTGSIQGVLQADKYFKEMRHAAS